MGQRTFLGMANTKPGHINQFYIYIPSQKSIQIHSLINFYTDLMKSLTSGVSSGKMLASQSVIKDHGITVSREFE